MSGDILSALAPADDFAARHIGPRAGDLAAMLEAVGAGSLDELIDQAVPATIRTDRPLELPGPLTESAMLAELAGLAAQNKLYRSYLGYGYHGCVTPPVILRNILENPGWYTAYTPYQAEIAQGRLEALLNFQTLTMDLTGLEVATSSLLDEATAAAEAMTMCRRVMRRKAQGKVFFVSERCHPQTVAVVRTRAEPLGIEVVVGDHATWDFSTGTYAVLIQYPDTSGLALDYRDFAASAKAAGAMVVVASDLLALTLLEAPGSWGADVVIGNSQRFGVPMGYGGPHAAFMACREEHKRQIPGRIVGVSRDAEGRPAMRLALTTREQHIRREKATSNICTAQVLLAVTASMYACYHGPDGLRRIARRVHAQAAVLAAALRGLGHAVAEGLFFDTVRVTPAGDSAEAVLARALARGINLRALDGDVVIALDETVEAADLADLYAVFGGEGFDLAAAAAGVDDSIPAGHARTSDFLTHPVFNRYRSETELLRYIHRLESRDLSLTTSMIALGSCTMKLNATAEMIPVTWPGFGALHPFAPPDQASGYRALFERLEAWLAEITGFAATSLQPNAGSQGEYSGLLVIRAWQRARGQGHRDVCLIPKSAHGTNPASAVMAGMRVVVVACDDQGNIDVDDLKAKAAKHADSLAALMVTYPSTHGVFEEPIREICQVVHDHGGKVYLDGANMNALVGVCRPAEFGADVCHLNLHKTFCLAESTPVTLASGVQRPIEELLVGQRVLAWSDEEQGLRAAPLEAAFRTGRRACVEVTLEDGRSLVLTPDHRVRTTAGWVQAGDLISGEHRILVGHAAPTDRPEERADERGWSARFGDLALSMGAAEDRERTLAWFRLLGLALSDGTYSQESATGHLQARLYLGAIGDAEAALDDIELLTGGRPALSPCNEVFTIRLPVELTRALEATPGVGAPGPLAHSTAGLPDVINDPATPLAALREFFGGLFGGDGCAPVVAHLDESPDAMKEVRFVRTRLDRDALEGLMGDIQRGLARLGVASEIGRPRRSTSTDRSAGPDADPRWRCTLTVRWGTAFAERVGFRYCAHKTARLTAATAWWRLRETVLAQRGEVAARALELGEGVVRPGGRDRTWRHVITAAYRQVAGAASILNPYYASFQGNQRVSRQHLEVALEGKPGAGTAGIRRGHRRAVLPAVNKRGEATGMPTLGAFLERTGASGWFAEHTPGGAGYKIRDASGQANAVEPVMHLGVVSVRPAGERTVYDLTVTALHSFLADGAVVHNCIPHGGGGPGMGPICMTAELAPFRPGHPLVETGGEQAIGPISAAPWGSPSILPISYAYIGMMGGQGLTDATKIAILNANYVASRLAGHYPVLYTGANGRVAHECILDTRPLKAHGVEVVDIAKRLMDYGFHAPTMSFPVPGTLMIEPTESESREELDRFCEAMISIREEIRAIERGEVDATINALKGAPHSADIVAGDAWDRPYSRQQAAWPAPWTREHKYWPPVSRIDDAYGDRHLVCACPPLEAYGDGE